MGWGWGVVECSTGFPDVVRIMFSSFERSCGCLAGSPRGLFLLGAYVGDLLVIERGELPTGGAFAPMSSSETASGGRTVGARSSNVER